MNRTARSPAWFCGARLPTALAGLILAACASAPSEAPVEPRDASGLGGGTPSAAATIQPMDRELMAIDLASAVGGAAAQNLEILQGRERVAAARGRYGNSLEPARP